MTTKASKKQKVVPRPTKRFLFGMPFYDNPMIYGDLDVNSVWRDSKDCNWGKRLMR